MKVIKYIRVSTQKQGVSGLGLEAQTFGIDKYISSIGASCIAEFVEIESAGNKDRIQANAKFSLEKLLRKRPVLLQAIKMAEKEGATLVVKESTRLSRYSLIIDYLIAKSINFICSDNPNDDVFFTKMRVLFGEEELRKVSERTKAALQARKARGFKLGNTANLTEAGRKQAALQRSFNAAADEINRQVTKHILSDRAKGMTLQAIANELNGLGYKTSRGKEFQTSTVVMYLKRANKVKE